MSGEPVNNLGSRVYKKSSPSGRITLFVGKRDFVDHGTHVDTIDGVVFVDPSYVADRKVYRSIVVAFKYGGEDLDVLGLTFRKGLYIETKQIYPPELESQSLYLRRLQHRLIKKLGPNAYPFNIVLPLNLPASVTLQPVSAPGDKPCGVDYELRVFIGDSPEEIPAKRNCVRLGVKKVMHAPRSQAEQPSIEVSKDFFMSPGKLLMEVSLDKELYYHGEIMNVNVHITNSSNRTVRKIKIAVKQHTQICIFTSAQYRCNIGELECDIGLKPGCTMNKVFSLLPGIVEIKSNRTRTLALDGKVREVDTKLASSTIITDPKQLEKLGIIVCYKVKVKLCLGPLSGDLTAELPFTLMHQKSVEEEPAPKASAAEAKSENDEEEIDLIQLDADDGDEFFEDFARMRFQGGDIV